MTTHTWWQPPRLRTDEDEERERKVSWLELFYDLVFVVTVAELSHSLSSHVTGQGVIAFVLLFIPVWWVWIGGTFYNERFETEDVSNRLFTFLQMLPVGALAVFAHDALGETSTGFALSYAAARLLIVLLWWRGGRHVEVFRPVANRYVTGFNISAALFAVSVFVSPPARFVLWGIGLLIDLVTPVTTLELQKRLPRYSTSRLPERFGLFVIIVLGESIVGVVSGVAAKHALTPAVGLTAALGMALAFGLWWVYFDFIARRHPRPGIWRSLAWSYLHLPLVMAITAVGAGVLNVTSLDGGALPGEVRWLMAGAVAAALITMGAIELTLRRYKVDAPVLRWSASVKIATGLVAAAVGWLGGGLGATAILIVLLALVAAHAVYGVYVWFNYIIREPGLEAH